MTGSNVRKSFFQAVSNSSWANEGDLVATSIADANTEHELRMLSALHGIGVIVLNTSNPSESEFWLPARTRPEVDWQSVIRIVEENTDFKAYIEQVSAYYKMDSNYVSSVQITKIYVTRITLLNIKLPINNVVI
ncbi:hypothetical protein OE993_004605, partial [Vibrio parahaemolyticus]|nr:hypothetical protein [Vibrio parahaemolyticus]